MLSTCRACAVHAQFERESGSRGFGAPSQPWQFNSPPRAQQPQVCDLGPCRWRRPAHAPKYVLAPRPDLVLYARIEPPVRYRSVQHERPTAANWLRRGRMAARSAA